MAGKSNSKDEESVKYLIANGLLSADSNGWHLDEPPSDGLKEDFPYLISTYDGIPDRWIVTVANISFSSAVRTFSHPMLEDN